MNLNSGTMGHRGPDDKSLIIQRTDFNILKEFLPLLLFQFLLGNQGQIYLVAGCQCYFVKI